MVKTEEFGFCSLIRPLFLDFIIMAAVNQTSVNLLSVGGAAINPQFTYTVDPSSTISATLSGNVLTVDATGCTPGDYAVVVKVAEGSNNTTKEIIPVTVYSPQFRIKEASLVLVADTLPATRTITLSTMNTNGDPVTWSLGSSGLPGVTINPTTGTLTIPVSSYTRALLEVKASTPIKTVTKNIIITTIPSKPYRIQDGALVVSLNNQDTFSKGNYYITATVKDSRGTSISYTSYITTQDPLSSVRIDDFALPTIWTKQDTGTGVIAIQGSNPTWTFTNTPQPSILGMQSLFDTNTNGFTFQAPPTKFGPENVLVKVPLYSGTTLIGYLSRQISAAAVSGDLNNWGNANSVTLEPMLVGNFYQVNPLQPWPNSARLVMAAGWTAHLEGANELPPGLSFDSNTGNVYGNLLGSFSKTTTITYRNVAKEIVGSLQVKWNIHTNDFGSTLPTIPAIKTNSPTSFEISYPNGGTLQTTSLVYAPYPDGTTATIVTGNKVRITVNTPICGWFNIWVSTTNAQGKSNLTRVRFNVAQQNPVTILTTSLPVLTTGASYNSGAGFRLLGYGGVGEPYTWALQSGSLPSGITLSSDGLLSGTTTVATYDQNLTFSFTDAAGNTTTKVLQLRVLNALEILTTVLPAMQTGSAYSATLVGQGGTPSTYAWSIASGTLPTGFTLSTAGKLTGTGPATAYDQNLTFRLSDSTGNTTKTFRLQLNNTLIPLTVKTSYGDIKRGCAVAISSSVTGGAAPYAWSVDPALPAGLSLDTTTGGISGKTTAAWADGTTWTLKAVDSSGASGSTALSLKSVKSLEHSYTVSKAASGTWAVCSGVPDANVGAAYSYQMIAKSCNTPLSFALKAGSSLPAGLTLSSSGVISGTPTAYTIYPYVTSGTGSYPIVVVTDAASDTIEIPVPIFVQANAVVVTNTSLPTATLGGAYSAKLTATGGRDALYKYVLGTKSGALPSGFTIEHKTDYTEAYLKCAQVSSVFPDVDLTFKASDSKGTGPYGTESAALKLSCASSFAAQSIYAPQSGLLGIMGTISAFDENSFLVNNGAFRFKVTGLVKLATNTNYDYNSWCAGFSAISNVKGFTAKCLPNLSPNPSNFSEVYFQVCFLPSTLTAGELATLKPYLDPKTQGPAEMPIKFTVSGINMPATEFSFKIGKGYHPVIAIVPL